MEKVEFEDLLDKCCSILTYETVSTGFKSSEEFENRVREILAQLTAEDSSVNIDLILTHKHSPDIAMGEFGVEVKYTKQNTWRCIANSILETQRIEEVKHIASIQFIFTTQQGGFSPRAEGRLHQCRASPRRSAKCQGSRGFLPRGPHCRPRE